MGCICTEDIAFHLSTCQLLPAPALAPNPYPGPGKGVKKIRKEQEGAAWGMVAAGGISMWLDLTLVEEGGC